jgi:pectinesterase
VSTLPDRRSVLFGAAAALAGPALAREPIDAVVGLGGHSSLKSALDTAPHQGERPFRILLGSGDWREKLTIAKPNVHLIGEDRYRSRLVFDAYAGQASPEGRTWGTRGSATLTIAAPGFTAESLTIANTFDYPAAIFAAQRGEPAPQGLQAVALALGTGCDRAQFRHVDIEGYQDTLFTDAGRSHFEFCRIAGCVDFIFGAGTAVFEDCEITSRNRGARGGYVAAPSTLLDRPYGLVFRRCRLTHEPIVAKGSIALARPWRPTTTFADGAYGNPAAVGQAAFLECWLGDHIAAAGWDRMGYTNRAGERVFLEPAEVRFFEFRNHGPGANGATRRQLTPAEASAFEPARVLAGWKA